MVDLNDIFAEVEREAEEQAKRDDEDGTTRREADARSARHAAEFDRLVRNGCVLIESDEREDEDEDSEQEEE